MKDMFPEYYRPSEEDFAKLWEEAIFVFDANVLLDIYRYSPQTSNELIEIIQNLENRVWLPYQFAFEYHKHLDEMSTFPPDNYDNAISQFEKLHNQLVTELNNLKNRTRIDTEQWSSSIKDTFENIKTEIAQQKTEHKEHLNNDIPSLLDEIFKNKIGINYPQETLNKIYREGKERYKLHTPPGYKDEKKSEPDCYNDFIGWKQMIDFAKQEKQSIIFITRDTKEDWFRSVKGIKSPRPELIKEMRDKASVSFYMYQTPQFMTYARDYLDSHVSDESIDEIESIRSDYENRKNISKSIEDITEQLQGSIYSGYSKLDIIDKYNTLASFGAYLTERSEGLRIDDTHKNNDLLSLGGLNPSLEELMNSPDIISPLMDDMLHNNDLLSLGGLNPSLEELMNSPDIISPLMDDMLHNNDLLSLGGLNPSLEELMNSSDIISPLMDDMLHNNDLLSLGGLNPSLEELMNSPDIISL